jgi:pyruvate/2-oxoacid:ferredoxin oxidoreductase beta subunit
MRWPFARAGARANGGPSTRAKAISRPARSGWCRRSRPVLAIALPHRKVIAIDGDGAFLMNLCGLPTIAMQKPGNFIHLLFDNEIYEASGGTATASRHTDAVTIAKGRGLQARNLGKHAGGV